MPVSLQTLPPSLPRELRKQIEDLVRQHNQQEQRLTALARTPPATVTITPQITQQIITAFAAAGILLPATPLTNIDGGTP